MLWESSCSFGIMTGLYVWLGMVGEGLVLACVILSQALSHDARLRAALAMCGLIFASILLVHPSGGYVESHILVMMAGIVLHQGLVISKRLVEMMHGSIGVESEPGAGSRFWFTVQFTEQGAGASAMSRDSGVGHIAA